MPKKGSRRRRNDVCLFTRDMLRWINVCTMKDKHFWQEEVKAKGQWHLHFLRLSKVDGKILEESSIVWQPNRSIPHLCIWLAIKYREKARKNFSPRAGAKLRNWICGKTNFSTKNSSISLFFGVSSNFIPKHKINIFATGANFIFSIIYSVALFTGVSRAPHKAAAPLQTKFKLQLPPRLVTRPACEKNGSKGLNVDGNPSIKRQQTSKFMKN